MRISPIDSYNYINGRYGIRDIPYAGQPEEQVSEKPVQQQRAEQGKADSTEQAYPQNNAPKSTDPTSVSLTFNRNLEFDSVSQGSPLQNLDMQRAISNIQKDSILSDYRRFVGDSVQQSPPLDGEPFLETPDGAVFLK